MRLIPLALRPHERIRDSLAAFVDGELEAPEAERAEAHLATCDACSRVVQDQRAVKQALSATIVAVPATRSFRLTPGMVAQAPPPTRTRTTTMVLRASQATGATAAIALGAFVLLDLNSSSPDGDSTASTLESASIEQDLDGEPAGGEAADDGGSAPEEPLENDRGATDPSIPTTDETGATSVMEEPLPTEEVSALEATDPSSYSTGEGTDTLALQTELSSDTSEDDDAWMRTLQFTLGGVLAISLITMAWVSVRARREQ